MATGKSSNHGASSSKKTAKKQEKRKQGATRAEQAKKPRPFQLINYTPQPHPRVSGSGSGTGTAVPGAVPLHRRASNNMAPPTAALPFPIPGVNGAAPLWSTAATLGAASRAAALTLSSLPATTMAAAAAPVVIAPAPCLQPPPPGAAASNAAAAAAVLPVPAASSGASAAVMPPLVLAPAGAGGQHVPVPLRFVGYHPTCCANANALLPAPAVGIPLAAALDKMENGALGRMLTALMPACHPPLRQHQSKTTGPPPPWWPTGSEVWWGPELLNHLDTKTALTRTPATPVPYASCYSLKKAQKVALLVAIVKHLAPDFVRIAAAVWHSGKLSASETHLWHSALNHERAKCMRPVFVLLPQPQPQPQQQGGGGGGGAGTDLSAAAGSVAVQGGGAATDGRELQVAIANLPAGASVSAPGDGNRGEVIAAVAELVEKEQRTYIDGIGVVSATDDAPAGGDGRGQPVNNFSAGGDGGSTHKQGAAVAATAAAPAGTGHVRQLVAGGPEMTMTMQQPEPEPEQHGGVLGNGGVAGAEDDQVQAHPVVDMGGHQWWHNDDELDRMFAEFESFGDVWC